MWNTHVGDHVKCYEHEVCYFMNTEEYFILYEVSIN